MAIDPKASTAELVRLRDLRPLTPDEHALTQRICAKITDLIRTRTEQIKSGQLDPATALPASNWDPDADQPFQEGFRFLIRGEYEAINRLRLHTPFTAVDLATQEYNSGGRFVPYLSADFDQQFAARVPLLIHWTKRYHLLVEHLPKSLHVTYPPRLGEIGCSYQGGVINHDAYAYQERVNLLLECGVIDLIRARIANGQCVNILEIGAGYGGLAHALASIFPAGINYILCDLPETMLCSSLYLGITKPHARHRFYEPGGLSDLKEPPHETRFVYLPNYQLPDLAAHRLPIDLAINTLSFPEMTAAQVTNYATILKVLLGNTGMMFEQNWDGRWLGLLDCKSILADFFPYRQSFSGRSIPARSKGKCDLWSNQPWKALIPQSTLPFRKPSERYRLFLWRICSLASIPHWGLSRLREALFDCLGPRLFQLIKNTWNRLGGQMRG